MLDSLRQRLQVEWVVSNLRWLLLLTVLVVAFLDKTRGFGGPQTLSLAILIGIGALYNLVLTLLLAVRLFPEPLPLAALVTDTMLAIGLMVASGGPNSPLLFFGLLPIITAALRFSLWVSILVALLLALGYLAPGLVNAPSLAYSDVLNQYILPRAGNLAVLFLTAVLTGWIGAQMKQRVAQVCQMEEEEELRRLRARQQQARLIFELASTLTATLNYQRVLEAILDVAEIGLHELSGQKVPLVGLILLFRRDQLWVAAARHIPYRDHQVTLEGSTGILATVLRSAEPALFPQPGTDPELSRFIALHQCREAMVVPLRAGFETFGVAVFGSPQAGTFTPEYQDLLVALCNQGTVALQNARLYESLLEEKERIVTVEEDARKKLARDLHDGPTQSIAAIAMRLNYARMLLNERPQEVAEELARIEELARRTTKEIRHMLFTLRPLILETQGLRAAMEQYIAKRMETDPLPIHLEAPEGVDRRLDKDQQGIIFYILEEAISNARKHARASNIWVRMRVQGDLFVAEVEDDGVGFDPAILERGYEERGSLGMLNMKERAELAGGKFFIRSAPGQGTTVRIEVPLKKENYVPA
ncbi:MAG: sensor histidine kinase [Anaerolineae bacterium]|nr:sensor histidine kinase [Anaerolineae bacterium]MCX8067999.1 sensor histidine kinase [Anaerolineae bacterium]MDW7991915.1 sensor histidine kinase [Anaerolineae bacterium]